MSDEPSSHDETWLFGGLRIGRNGKRLHVWIPEPSTGDHDELWFKATGSYVVGSEYTVHASRTETDGRTVVVMHGEPKYKGQHANTDVRAALEAHHRTASTEIQQRALEASDKRRSALDAALQPLLDIMAKVPAPQRDAYTAYILRRLHTTKPATRR